MNIAIYVTVALATVTLFAAFCYLSYFIGREIALRRMESKLREICNAHRTLKEQCRRLQRHRKHRK